LQSGFTQEQVRDAIGESAKTAGWFKRIDYGEDLGRIVSRALGDIPDKDISKKIDDLIDWIYG
jgi:hypothetical protein